DLNNLLMLPLLSPRRRFLLFLLIQHVVSIREEDDYDYVGIAENEAPPAPPTDSPSSLHEDMTKLEKYLAKKTQSNTILPEPKVRMHISPHVENIFLNEQAQTLWISMRVCMFWIDPRVRWNPKDFDSATTAFLHNWEVWSPRLTAIESVTPLHENVEYARIKVRRIGDFFYLHKCPGLHTTVECKIDAAAFPYDRQICRVILSDKTYNKNFDMKFVQDTRADREIEMKFPYASLVNRTHYGPWKLQNMTWQPKALTKHDFTIDLKYADKQKDIRFVYVITINLSREATFYRPTFLVPAFLFLSISAFSFMCRSRWLTLQLLSMNLLLLSLFITSSYKRFPIHYSATP
ncbi:hypothetical protein PENTCL1PPCAC_24784, partial [Pristionchus entomophagus]